MITKQWSFGDRVVHLKRPEWGTGIVTSTDKANHEGVPCQRLTIRFERAGVKTLSTAVADIGPAAAAALLPAEAEDAEPAAAPSQSPLAPARPAANLAPARNGPSATPEPGTPKGGWLDQVASASVSVDQVMARIPEPCTDPFKTPEQRLRATLDLYRFTDQGGPLIDWAAAQSGLKDPLSRFNRHELERFFKRFAVARDDHLKKLVLDLKKRDPALLGQTIRNAPPGAQHALRRLDILR